LPHVFDRFRQADQTTTRAHTGLGLGLAIVRQLVEMHGGTVSVVSGGEGQGTTFTVALPRLLTYHAERLVVARVHPTATGGRDFGGSIPFNCPPRLDGLRVLVVDDEADTLDLLSSLLERCGAEVTTAASAAEALESFAARTPEILISDIGMPGEDGYALIESIRALEAQRGGDRTPAIALTAYATVEDRVRALQAGFQVHVPKPIEPVELMAFVASFAVRIKN
nr:response regulator [Acidobacteriota bacterium]